MTSRSTIRGTRRLRRLINIALVGAVIAGLPVFPHRAAAHEGRPSAYFVSLAAYGAQGMFSDLNLTKNDDEAGDWLWDSSLPPSPPCEFSYSQEYMQPQFLPLTEDGLPDETEWRQLALADWWPCGVKHTGSLRLAVGTDRFAVRFWGWESHTVFALACTMTTCDRDLELFPPRDLQADASRQGSVTLSWRDNASVEDHFELQRSQDRGSTWETVANPAGDATSFVDDSVERSKKYFYRVRAIDSDGWGSGWSNVAQLKSAGVPIGQTFGLGNSHSILCTACAGDPVNTATGNYVEAITDAALPAIGLPFYLVRTYNSLDNSRGTLGRGWTHSYEVSLKEAPDQSVVLKAEDGARLVYDRRSDGSYLPNEGVLSTLEKVTDGFRLTRHDGVVYNFSNSGTLNQIVDRNGNRQTLGYVQGLLDTITDPAGRVIDLSYNGAGLVTSVRLPDGRSVQYAYDQGLLTAATDLRGKVTHYSYDEAGRLAEVTDPRGVVVVHNVYEDNGRVASQTDARGKTTRFYWDPAAQMAYTQDPLGNMWVDTYSDNVLQSRSDPLGNTSNFDYGKNLNLTRVTDPRGNTFMMTYDERHNLTSRTSPAPLSYEQTYSYNDFNEPTHYSDGRGNVTDFSYDDRGNLTAVTRPGGAVTKYDTNAAGLVSSVTDPLGRTTKFAFDAVGNRTRVTSPSGHSTTFEYDAGGRIVKIVDPRGNELGANPASYSWSFSHDATNHLTSQVDPSGHETRWIYDAAGNLESVTDANGHVRTYSYDPANEVNKIVAPGGAETTFDYDAVGNMISRKDANGRVTLYDYDRGNRLIRYRPPGKYWTYDYDANGNVVKKTVRSNDGWHPDVSTSYEYDALDRLISIDYSDGTPAVAYAYDANSNRVSMTDGQGTQSYSYDALDRLTSVARGGTGFSYDYDIAGELTKRGYPDGAQTTYGYNADGLMASATTEGARTSYDYDAAGNQVRATLPNAFVETRNYDNASRLVSMANTLGSKALWATAYTRDAVGNPVSITATGDQASRSTTTAITYDAADRLTSACFAPPCTRKKDAFVRYTYDAMGNRLTEERNTGVTVYEYDDADQLIVKRTSTSETFYSYDPAGNQVQAGGRALTYDGANRLASSTSPSGATTQFSYDGDGNRIRSASSGGTPADTRLVWDVNFALPQLALEVDANGQTVRRYAYGLNRVSLRAGGADHYFHYDPQGSVVGLTSSSGRTERSYSYEPFGGEITSTATNGAPENPMRFQGQLYDASTSAYYMRARDYDSANGGFLQRDPLDLYTSTSASSYSFVHGRPLVWRDPAGLMDEIAGDGGISGISEAPGSFGGLGGGEYGGEMSVAEMEAANPQLPAIETWGRGETLVEHFESHGADFAADCVQDYAGQASDFFTQSQQEGLPTKIGPDGAIRVYDPETNTFGAYNSNGTTRTFFKPSTGAQYWENQSGSAPEYLW